MNDSVVFQFDLDPVRSYLASYHGQSRSGSGVDGVYVKAIPRILDLLRELGARATFFIVGHEVEIAGHIPSLKAIVDDGHELANHSQLHLLGLSRRSRDRIESEILEAERCVRRRLGVTMSGFRAPGWDVSSTQVRILRERGYRYDSSICPSWVGPLQSAAVLLLSRRRGDAGLGRLGPMFGPTAPYFPDLDRPWRRGAQRDLVEVPAGVAVGTRIPLCATIQARLPKWMLKRAIGRASSRTLIYLAHGIDFLDASEIDSRLSVHPGAMQRLETKVGRIREACELMMAGRSSMTTTELAEDFLARAAPTKAARPAAAES